MTPKGYLGVRLHLLRARGQPVRVLAGRRRSPRGGRRAARDAARAAGRPHAGGSAGGSRSRVAAVAAHLAARRPARLGRRRLAGRRRSRSPKMLEAGANCLPVALLFLGIAALAYALVPRASARDRLRPRRRRVPLAALRLASRRAEVARRRDAVRARRVRPRAAVPRRRGRGHGRERRGRWARRDGLLQAARPDRRMTGCIMRPSRPRGVWAGTHNSQRFPSLQRTRWRAFRQGARHARSCRSARIRRFWQSC